MSRDNRVGGVSVPSPASTSGSKPLAELGSRRSLAPRRSLAWRLQLLYESKPDILFSSKKKTDFIFWLSKKYIYIKIKKIEAKAKCYFE